jgi:transmembrane sensor
VQPSPRDDEQIYDEAALWWYRSLNGDGFDSAAFEAWLALDPRHRTVFADVSLTDKVLDDNGAEPELLAMRRNALDDIYRAGGKRWLPRGVTMSRRGVVAAGLAGGAVALAGAAVGLLKGEKSLKTGVGELRTVTLADNSTIVLDANSHINIAFKDDIRRIELLAGRAHFEVAKDPSRPFIVNASNKFVTAIGTAFTVEYREKIVAVTLAEGKISIDEDITGAPSRTVSADIEPSQELVISADKDAPAVRENVDLDKSMSWREGKLFFENKTLIEAASRMNDYSHTKLVFEGDDVGKLRISGMFLAGHTDAFVGAIEALYAVNVQYKDNYVIIKSHV